MAVISPYRKNVFAALAGVAFVASTGILLACQVPVFRYALERWTPDHYNFVVVPSQGGLTADESAAVEFLETTAGSTDFPANLAVRVDESGTNATDATMAKLFYPSGRRSSPVWEGALTMENARRLVDSPARRKLATEILKGESSIWVLVESGNEALDNEAVGVLEAELASAQDSLELPEGVIGRDKSLANASGPVDLENILQSDVPLKIDFSVLRLDRLDPDEAIFLTMFLNLEDDLGELSAEPMVFPVFGRGRVLEPLVGRGITEGNILDYAAYLCGACSCEVKDQNPGMDLLMVVNWDAAIEGSKVIIDKILPPLEGTAALIAPPETEPSTPPVASLRAEFAVAGPAQAGSGFLFREMALVVGLVIVLIAVASRFILRKSPR